MKDRTNLAKLPILSAVFKQRVTLDTASSICLIFFLAFHIELSTSSKIFPLIWYFYVRNKNVILLSSGFLPLMLCTQPVSCTNPSVLPELALAGYFVTAMRKATDADDKTLSFLQREDSVWTAFATIGEDEHLQDAKHREQCPLCVLADRATLRTPANL